MILPASPIASPALQLGGRAPVAAHQRCGNPLLSGSPLCELRPTVMQLLRSVGQGFAESASCSVQLLLRDLWRRLYDMPLL